MDVFMNLKPVFHLSVKANSFKKLNRFYLNLNRPESARNLKLLASPALNCLLLANFKKLKTKTLSHSRLKWTEGKMYLEFTILKELDGIGLEAYIELFQADSVMEESTAVSLFHTLELDQLEFNITDQFYSHRLYETFGNFARVN